MMPLPGDRRMIVLVVTWHDLDGTCSEAFGPWTVQEDGSHHAKIAAFLNEWAATRTPISFTTYLVTPVAEAL